jgi:hypothetical protein
LDAADLVATVAALSARRALGGDDLVVVDAAQERLLYVQHVRHLADSEEGRVLVVHG